MADSKKQNTKQRISSGEWSWGLDHENDSFEFNCSSCGECCRGEMNICLNLADMQRMAKFLNLKNTGDLIKGGWIRYDPLIDDELHSKRPTIVFKKSGNLKFCPFLENRLTDDHKLLGLCTLHPRLKPLVCKLAPLGREIVIDEISNKIAETWQFVEPVKGCPGCQVEQPTHHCAQWTADDSDELETEIEYFRVLDAIGRIKNVQTTFLLQFHSGLAVGKPIQEYIEEWKQKIAKHS